MIRTNIEEIYNTNEEPNKIDFSNGRNIIYFNRRKELKQMIKSINGYVNNNSQSLFLAYYFMDLIFTNNDLEKVFFQHFNLWDYLIPLKDIQMNNYALLSLACLIILINLLRMIQKFHQCLLLLNYYIIFQKKTLFLVQKI